MQSLLAEKSGYHINELRVRWWLRQRVACNALK